MPTPAPDLFKNRSVTQEFLFSHSDDLIRTGSDQKTAIDPEAAGTAPLACRFPDMLDRLGLVREIEAHMASVQSLAALAIRIEPPIGKTSGNLEGKDILEAPLTPIAALSRDHDGRWAQIGRDRFACVCPHLTAADGQALAHRLLDTVADAHGLPVTIGVAAYPTINYTRSQIVDNAEKALDHAGFFGPGTVTGFDAVSLNISGDRRYQAGDIAGAMDAFKKGLRLDPSDVNLHNSLGVCHGVLKDYDNALNAFENAIWLAPEEIMPIYNKGYILLLKGKREEALRCFFEAHTREPDVFEVVFHIGQVFMEMGDTEKARPFLEAATNSNSRSGPAFKRLGACLDKLGLTKEAIQAYKRAVKIDPADGESLSMLGRLYAKRGESLGVASVLCEQSVHLSPDDGVYRHRLGIVYLNQGRLGHALAEFELAVTLGHDSRQQIEETRDRMIAAKAS
jgi:tetratricopeptide (TPR) repeat protein